MRGDHRLAGEDRASPVGALVGAREQRVQRVRDAFAATVRGTRARLAQCRQRRGSTPLSSPLRGKVRGGGNRDVAGVRPCGSDPRHHPRRRHTRDRTRTVRPRSERSTIPIFPALPRQGGRVKHRLRRLGEAARRRRAGSGLGRRRCRLARPAARGTRLGYRIGLGRSGHGPNMGRHGPRLKRSYVLQTSTKHLPIPIHCAFSDPDLPRYPRTTSPAPTRDALPPSAHILLSHISLYSEFIAQRRHRGYRTATRFLIGPRTVCWLRAWSCEPTLSRANHCPRQDWYRNFSATTSSAAMA